MDVGAGLNVLLYNVLLHGHRCMDTTAWTPLHGHRCMDTTACGTALNVGTLGFCTDPGKRRSSSRDSWQERAVSWERAVSSLGRWDSGQQ